MTVQIEYQGTQNLFLLLKHVHGRFGKGCGPKVRGFIESDATIHKVKAGCCRGWEIRGTASANQI